MGALDNFLLHLIHTPAGQVGHLIHTSARPVGHLIHISISLV